MQSTNPFFDDLAKVATGAAGTFAGAAREFEGQAREKMREWLGGQDLVSRDEFDACRALAARAIGDVELLKVELARLRAEMAAHAAAGAATASATPSANAADAPGPEAARGGAGPDGTFTG